MSPCTLVDDSETRRCVALQTDTAKDLENHFRINVVKMGYVLWTFFAPFRMG